MLGGLSVAWLAIAPLLMWAEPPSTVDVVVTAAPPINAERLADALRAYLKEYGIRVQTAPTGTKGDLRDQLADARRTGEGVRAVAVVRAERGGVGLIEIELVDLATEKALITSVPHLQREEDLYRALALKIQALLRSTLSEAPERVAPGSPVARLVVPSTDGLSFIGGPGEPRLSLETGYAALSFPLGGPFTQGLSVTAAFAPRPWFDLTLGVAGLTSMQAKGSDVVAVATIVPVQGSARLHLPLSRFDLFLGPSAEIAVTSVKASSATTEVRSTRDLLAALGLETEGRVHFDRMVWFYVRVAALGVVLGQRYRVEGQAVLDTSRFQVTGSAGIGAGIM